MIEIANLNRTVPPTRLQMRDMADYLVQQLGASLGSQLCCFKRHIVEGEASVSTFYGSLDDSPPLGLSVEGAVLVQMQTDRPPKINAEVLMFSQGERIGTHGTGGKSYLLLDFDLTQVPNRWAVQGWLQDGPEDWEHIVSPRSEEYQRFEETWEDNQ